MNIFFEGAMMEMIREEMEYMVQKKPEQFFGILKELLTKQNHEKISEAFDVLTGVFTYLMESRRKSELEALIPQISKIITQFSFIKDKSPALLNQKGRLEALFQVAQYFNEIAPDVEWFLKLKGKYEEQILLYLYRNNAGQVSKIASHLGIKIQQLSPLIKQLEEEKFLYRESEGRNVWCSLTKKGFIMGKYLEQTQSLDSVAVLIQEITKLISNRSSTIEIDGILDKHRRNHPELTQIIMQLSKLSKLKSIYNEPILDFYGWHINAYSDLSNGARYKNTQNFGFLSNVREVEIRS